MSYVYIFFFQTLFPYRLLQNTEYSSLCYTVGICWLSVLCIYSLNIYWAPTVCQALCSMTQWWHIPRDSQSAGLFLPFFAKAPEPAWFTEGLSHITSYCSLPSSPSIPKLCAKPGLAVDTDGPDTSCGLGACVRFLALQWGEVKWSEVKSLSRVQLFATPWTVAYQASQTMGFSRQEYWSGLPLPSPGDLPSPGIERRSPAL